MNPVQRAAPYVSGATSLHSPKVNGVPGIPKWYGYYAGYSPAFVRDVLDAFDLPVGSSVIDPWNGAGTTTEVAASMGYRSFGFDLNPVLVIVARARCLGVRDAERSERLIETVMSAAADRQLALPADPLETWLSPASAASVRGIESALRRLLLEVQVDRTWLAPVEIEQINGTAALFYVGLFETVRNLLRAFRTTNPAWMKRPSSKRQRLRPSEATVRKEFESAVARLMAKLIDRGPGVEAGKADISRADAAALPLTDACIDAGLCSPPYCTRIDYVMATLPELAILGYAPGGSEVRALRQRMLGTPTMQSEHTGINPPAEVSEILKAIRSHPSRASGGYYRRYYEQYFSQLLTSLAELRRVIRQGGTCGIVVQDSWYKDVHVDLPVLTMRLAEKVGWQFLERRDFTVPRTKAAMNPRSRAYRQSFDSVESLIVLHRS